MNTRPILAFVMSNEIQTIAITQIIIIVGAMGKFLYDMFTARTARTDRAQAAKDLRADRADSLAQLVKQRELDRLDREQDRLDREQLAKFTKAQMDDVKTAGNSRLEAIVKEVREAKGVAQHGVNVNLKQIAIANTRSEKVKEGQEAINATVELAKQVLGKLEDGHPPQTVLVVNPNPIPVENRQTERKT